MHGKTFLSRKNKYNSFKANTNLIISPFEGQEKKRPEWLKENSAPDLRFQQAT